MDLPDVQNRKGEYNHALQAGVTNLTRPIKLKVKGGGEQETIAQITLTVHLPSDRKGVNMSRLPIALNGIHWDKYVGDNIGEILLDTLSATKSESAEVSLAFPYFIEKASPVTDHKGIMHVDCMIAGARQRTELHVPYTTELMVRVPVMTLCPCSKELSEKGGAHNQRALVEMTVFYRSDTLIWIEDLINVAEEAASSGIYPIIKRPDEKWITDHAYANPKFVEDVARGVANKIDNHGNIIAYEVQVSSEESIHQHNAIAIIRG